MLKGWGVGGRGLGKKGRGIECCMCARVGLLYGCVCINVESRVALKLKSFIKCKVYGMV